MPSRPGLAAFAGLSAEALIAFSSLPLLALQRDVADRRRQDQERHHGNRDGGALAEQAAVDAALEGQRCHQMGRIVRPAAGDRIDQLEIGEGEQDRSEEHTSELQSLMRISYAVFCLKKKKTCTTPYTHQDQKNTKY